MGATEHEEGLWDTIVRVTHWTTEQAASSKKKPSVEIQPYIVLNELSDLLTSFEFVPTNGSSSDLTPDHHGDTERP